MLVYYWNIYLDAICCNLVHVYMIVPSWDFITKFNLPREPVVCASPPSAGLSADNGMALMLTPKGENGC